MDNSDQQQVPVQQLVQPVQSEAPPPPNSSSFLKTLSIGLGVVGIGIVIGIGGYSLGTNKNQKVSSSPVAQLSPTPDLNHEPTGSAATANWKTYSDNLSGFSFKNPPAFTIEKLSPIQNVTYPKIISWTGIKSLQGDKTIYVSVAENTGNLTLDNALGHGPSLSYVSDYLKNKNIQTIQIDGSNSVLVENVDNIGPGDGPLKFDIITIENNKIFQFYSFDTSYSEFSSIVSTFKFTP